jgi:hypothetical protein
MRSADGGRPAGHDTWAPERSRPPVNETETETTLRFVRVGADLLVVRSAEGYKVVRVDGSVLLGR